MYKDNSVLGELVNDKHNILANDSNQATSIDIDTSDLDDILDLEAIVSEINTSKSEVDYQDYNLNTHLDLADYNSIPENEFKLIIPKEHKYPYLSISKDKYVAAHFKNLYSSVDKGDIPLIIVCNNEAEELGRVQLSSSNLITLKRIFNTEIVYHKSSEDINVIEPIDLFTSEDIF